MSRTVPFKKTAICDGCGATGAYDFMGDYLCQKCADEAVPSEGEGARESDDILTRLRAEAEYLPTVAKPLDDFAAYHIDLYTKAAAEIDDLRCSVIAFGAIAMVNHAKDFGLPDGHLFPSHYDILARAGARMDSFVRHEFPADEASA